MALWVHRLHHNLEKLHLKHSHTDLWAIIEVIIEIDNIQESLLKLSLQKMSCIQDRFCRPPAKRSQDLPNEKYPRSQRALHLISKNEVILDLITLNGISSRHVHGIFLFHKVWSLSPTTAVKNEAIKSLDFVGKFRWYPVLYSK